MDEMSDLLPHLPDPRALQRPILLQVPVQARKQIPRVRGLEVQPHARVEKGHEGRPLRVGSVGAPVDYEALFQMWVTGEDTVDVGEIAHFVWGRED